MNGTATSFHAAPKSDIIMRKLNLLTLIYISLPTLLFLILWLEPVFSVLSTLALLIVFALSNKFLAQKDCTIIDDHKLKQILLSSFAVAFLLCLVSEFGILPYESYDYTSHNLKFNILATNSLPLYDEERDTYMCYYLGNYLVPAFLGKYTSIAFIRIYSFIWSFIGIGLAFTWLQIRLRDLTPVQRIGLCMALLIGSYVCIIRPAVHDLFPELSFIKDNSIQLNEVFVLGQIPILTRSLSESPQHTVPAVLGICYLFATFARKSFFFSLAYFLLSTLFLAPFAAIGLVSYLLYACIKNLLEGGKTYFWSCVLFLIPLLVAFGPVMLYLTSSEATDMESNRFIWSSGTPYWWAYYLFFLSASYGVWFLFFGKQIILFDRTAIIISCLFLVLLSTFQMGHYNDLNMRAGIIPQMVLAIAIVYVIFRNWGLLFKNYLFTVGVFFWMLNSLSPLKFYYDRFFVLRGKTGTVENPGLERYGKSYYDFMEKAYPVNPEEAVAQYSLKKGSLFETHLLKKQTAVSQ